MISAVLSFPRKRESSEYNEIPAFAGMTGSSGMTSSSGMSTDDEATLAAFKLLGLGFGALATASMAKLFAPGETRTDTERNRQAFAGALETARKKCRDLFPLEVTKTMMKILSAYTTAENKGNVGAVLVVKGKEWTDVMKEVVGRVNAELVEWTGSVVRAVLIKDKESETILRQKDRPKAASYYADVAKGLEHKGTIVDKIWEGVFDILEYTPNDEARDHEAVAVLNTWFSNKKTDLISGSSPFARRFSWLLLGIGGLLKGEIKPSIVAHECLSAFADDKNLIDPGFTAPDRAIVMSEVTSLFEMLVKAKWGMESSFLRSTMTKLHEMVSASLKDVPHANKDLYLDILLTHATSEHQKAFLLKLGVLDRLPDIAGGRLMLLEVNRSEPAGSALKKITDDLLGENEQLWDDANKRLKELVTSSMEAWIKSDIKEPDMEVVRGRLRRLTDIGLKQAKIELRSREIRRK